jgi:hypothetical protein
VKFEPVAVSPVESGGGLDLDRGDLAGVVLDGVFAVALVVEEADGLLGPACVHEQSASTSVSQALPLTWSSARMRVSSAPSSLGSQM